ncbi:MAG: hypothetical protein GTO14_02550 [Anaerolineales bacterium]|nr:hypothetical protein [Anaerolineales bacterium]
MISSIIPVERTPFVGLLPDELTATAYLTPTPPPLPDLVVESIEFDWETTEPCFSPDTAAVRMQFEVTNMGKANSGRFVVMFNDLGFEDIDSGLQPGQSIEFEYTDLTYSWGVDAGEPVTLWVDYEDEVLEENEGNNSITSQLREPGAPPPCNQVQDPAPTREPDMFQLLPSNQPVLFRELHMLTPASGWAIHGPWVGEDQHILHTFDGGRTWLDVTPPGQDPAGDEISQEVATYFLDSRTAWAIYHNFLRITVNPVWHTKDGGRTWEAQSVPEPRVDRSRLAYAPLIEFSDAEHGWILVEVSIWPDPNEAELYRTIDGGETWELLEDRSLTRARGLDFFDAEHGWVFLGSRDSLRLAYTDDGGLTWQDYDVPTPTELLDQPFGRFADYHCDISTPKLHSARAGRFFWDCVSFYPTYKFYSYILETEDAGQSWEITSVPCHTLEFADLENGWGKAMPISDDGEQGEVEEWYLFRTQDGGQSWERLARVERFSMSDFVSERVGWNWAYRDPEVILKHTMDGGRTWEQLEPLTRASKDDQRLPSELQSLGKDNVQAMQVLIEFPSEDATELEFHPDGDALYVAHADGKVSLQTVKGGDYLKVTWVHIDWIYAVDISTDGELIATASKDGRFDLRILHGYGIEGYGTFKGHEGAEVTSIALSPDGRTLATGSEDSTVKTWDFPSIDPGMTQLGYFRTMEGHAGWVWDVAFSPNGRTLASASDDRTVRLWDVMSGEELHILDGHTSVVWRVAFSPDGTTLASGSWDGTVKLWDVSNGKEIRTLRGHAGYVNDIALSPDGDLLASASTDGTVILWDQASGEPLHTLHEHSAAVRALAFSPDGELLATISNDGRLLIWGVP